MDLVFVKVLLLLVLTARSEGLINGKTTCESGGLGEKARVACHFSEDVKKTREVRVVLLTRVSLHSARRNIEKVVRCYPFPGNGFDCLDRVGYTTNGTISDQMIVDIPTATQEHQGTYACQIVMANATFQMENCTLKYTEVINGKTTCEIGGLGEQASLTCHFSQDVMETREVRAVLLTRVSLHGESRNLEKVVRCYPFPGNGFDCQVGVGYKTNGTISDQMIVDIPTATPELEGTYACQIVMAHSTLQTKSCTLKHAVSVTERATCESTGLGEPARVTCHYGENVVEARHVRVVSLLHDMDGQREKVVECLRFLNNGFDCLPKTGYTLDGAVSYQMIIDIPRARPEHQGTYYCEIGIQQTQFQMESCDLNYSEHNHAATAAQTPKKESDDQLKGDTGTSNYTGWLIASNVSAVIGIMLLAVVLFNSWIHRRQRNRRQQDTSAVKPGKELDILIPASSTNDGNGPR